jgi:polar amino acid transport system substrate-binding protein
MVARLDGPDSVGTAPSVASRAANRRALVRAARRPARRARRSADARPSLSGAIGTRIPGAGRNLAQRAQKEKDMKFGTWPVALVALAALVAGCGGGGGTSGSSSTPTGTGSGAASSADPAVARLVPPKYKSKTLVVAADATYPPNEFLASDGKTVQGMDADLAKGIGGVMGVKVDVRNATFDAIIPGLANGKYDLGMSSFSDTKEREKTVDFVTYFSAGTSFYTKAGGPAVTSLAALCNKTVAVEKGTTQQADAEAQGKKCKVNVLTFPDQNGANLAISSGRAQVGMADSPVAAYIVKKSNGQFKLTGKPYGTAPYGIAIPKGSGLVTPVQQAVQALMRDGTYKRILTKWGIQAGAISAPQVNAAKS